MDSPHIFNRMIRFLICGVACILPCIYAGRFADDEKMLIGKVVCFIPQTLFIYYNLCTNYFLDKCCV